jgi:hypothetical protein
MQDTDLFQLALGLLSPWTVTRSEFDAVDGRLDLYVDFPRGAGSQGGDAVGSRGIGEVAPRSGTDFGGG